MDHAYCDIGQFEQLMAIHCAPVLCHKKAAGMFHITKKDFTDISKKLAYYNQQLNSKDIYLTILQADQQRITIYIFRQQVLRCILKRKNTQKILKAVGYHGTELEQHLKQLDERLHLNTYPHEIGLFLGYPPQDVEGFINQAPCFISGYWKVYRFNRNIIRLFTIYDECIQTMLKAVLQGVPIVQLI